MDAAMNSRAVIQTLVVSLLVAVLGLVLHHHDAEALKERLAEEKRELSRAAATLADARSNRIHSTQSIAQLREKSEGLDRLRRKTAEDLLVARGALQALEETLQGLRMEQASLIRRFAVARQEILTREAGLKYPRVSLTTGKALTDAEIHKVTPDTITFKHSGGMTSARASDLSPALKEKFLIVDTSEHVLEFSNSGDQAESNQHSYKKLDASADLIQAIKNRTVQIHRLDKWIVSTQAEAKRLTAQISGLERKNIPNTHLVSQLKTKIAALESAISINKVQRHALVENQLSDVESARIEIGKHFRTQELYGSFLDNEKKLWRQRLISWAIPTE